MVGLQKGRGGAIGEGCARGTLLKGTLAGVGVRIGGKWNLKPTPGPSARPKALHGPRLPREGAAFQFTQRHGVGHLSAPERLSDLPAERAGLVFLLSTCWKQPLHDRVIFVFIGLHLIICFAQLSFPSSENCTRHMGSTTELLLNE